MLCSLAGISESYAEFRDPTRPAFYSTKKAGAEHNQADYLKLSSIWISGRSKRVIINGKTAEQGEHIFSNIKVVKIFNDSVLIEQNGLRKTLYLLTRPYKNQ